MTTRVLQIKNDPLQIRWHGRGGQGSFTAARLLGLVAVNQGKFALAFPTFGPERRGAPVLGFTKIADQRVDDRSEIKECDYIVVLDESLVNADTVAGLKPGGTVLINTLEPEKYHKLFPNVKIVTVGATDIALREIGLPITNTTMLGALAAIDSSIMLKTVIEVLKAEMSPKLAEKNIAALIEAYNAVKGVPCLCALV